VLWKRLIAGYLWKTWKHSEEDGEEVRVVIVEVPFAHYLVENKIWRHPSHVLYSV
jgi:hypothetical protein